MNEVTKNGGAVKANMHVISILPKNNQLS